MSVTLSFSILFDVNLALPLFRPPPSANLAAQHPNLLRGVYYEHWRPAATAVKRRSKADFLARARAAFVNDPVMDGDESYPRCSVPIDEDKRGRA